MKRSKRSRAAALSISRARQLLAITVLLVGCAQPSSPAPVTDFAYDGLDHSWSSGSTTLGAQALGPRPQAIDPGDNTLSYEAWTSATNGWGPVERDRSNGEKNAGDGRTLTIAGQSHARGFGVHANSSMTFRLAGQCSAFTASVGIDDEVGDRGSVVFQVYADGTKLYDSEVVRGADAARAVSVSVAGADDLRLVVTDAGDGINYDHANWASAVVRGCVPAPATGPRGHLDGTPAELVFSGTVSSTGAPQSVTIRNTGAGPLRLEGAALTGANPSAFRLVNPPTWPLTLPSGQSVGLQVGFAPGSALGPLQAALQVTSDDPQNSARTVNLYGLSARGEEGDLEPPLQQVVQTLGYSINVGGSGLILSTQPTLIGDEVAAPLFTRAGPGPVTLRPVARYSPADPVPFGYYTPGSAGPSLHQVAVLAPRAHQTLNPAILPAGQTSFDPGSRAFGIYAGRTSYAPQNSYTQDTLNTAPVKHAARVYPLRDRGGQPLAHTFLVAFEPAVNGDYQDYVFVVSNVKPVAQAVDRVNWTDRASALMGVNEAQGAAVNGRLYVFGGFDSSLRATTRSQVYDLAADRWAPAAGLPEPLTHGAVAVDGTTVYLAGGFVGNHPGPQTDHVWKYDTVTDTWAPGVPLPAARGGGAMVRLGRELHFFGGVVRDPRNTNVYLRDSADHWVLNLDGGTSWQSAAPLPNPRNHMAGAVLNGKIYAIGGQHLGDEEAGNQSAVHMYDPATERWTARADLPLPLGHINASTTVWRGRIVVVAGVTQRSAEVDDVLEYDPVANAWTALTPLPAARQSPVADIIGDTLVVTGGSLPSGVKVTTWTGTR